MKKQMLGPLTLSTLVVALAGCGGESANVNPEPNQVNSVNGSCEPYRVCRRLFYLS